MNLLAKVPTALFALTLVSPLTLSLAVYAQNGFGPIDPTPPTGITVDQIVQKFGEREAEFKQAREN